MRLTTSDRRRKWIAVLLSLAILLTSAVSFSQVIGTPPSMTNISITQIDYQNNIPATDSEWMNMDPPQNHPSLERWNPPSGNGWNVSYIVYKKGNTIFGVTTYTNDQTRAVNWSLAVNSGSLISEADEDLLEWGFLYEQRSLSYSVTSATYGTVAPGGTFDVNWTITNAPNFLCAGWMSLPITLNLTYADEEFPQQYVNQDSLAGINLSIMVDQPVDMMSTPWADLTYEVGLWGWGATSTSQAQEYLVNGIHYSNRHWMRGRFVYDAITFRYCANPSAFLVGKLVGHLHSRLYVDMDCNDFSQLLCLSFEANGINAGVRRLQYSLGDGNFFTNLMCPAGYDSTMISLYKEFPFNLHMVVAPDGMVVAPDGSSGSACSDASSSYRHNLSGGSHLNPANRWPLPNYWRREINGITVGLANRPQDSAIPPGTPYDSNLAAINFQATQLLTDVP